MTSGLSKEITHNKDGTKKSKLSKQEYKKLLKYALKHFPQHHRMSLLPLFKSLVGVGICTVISLYIDFKLFPKLIMKKMSKTGAFLLFYIVGIFATRAFTAKTSTICYEVLWGCNLSMILAGIGFMLGRPFSVGMATALVGLDQTVWYGDVISYALRKKYLIGAAAYLSHPEQTFIRSATSLHHLWFMPYCMVGLYKANSYLHPKALFCGMSVGVLSMYLGRALIPLYAWVPVTLEIDERLKQHQHSDFFRNLRHDGRYLEYLNVNAAWEFYPTVGWSFLHYFNAKPWFIYIPAISVPLISFSAIPFYLMRLVSVTKLEPRLKLA